MTRLVTTRRTVLAALARAGTPAGVALLAGRPVLADTKADTNPNTVANTAASPDARIVGTRLPNADGQLQDVVDGRATATLVDFWASWCTPCRLSFPWMNDLHARLSSRGLRIVAVNLDANREDADRFLARYPARFEVLYDAKGELAKRLALRGMPSSLLLSATGRLRWTHTGFRSSEAAALEARIVEALAPT
jgi:cytochrome c biogenesis protein CcmG, thiol:disulfide interchange protein DsbE